MKTHRIAFAIALSAGVAAPPLARAVPPGDDYPHNGLQVEHVLPSTLQTKANLLLPWLAHHALSELHNIPNGALGAQLHDNIDLLTHMVQCAAGADASLPFPPWYISHYPHSAPLRGLIGLCSGAPPFGDWAKVAPSADCLQIVSSCVLAHVNGLNERVIFSPRGEIPPFASSTRPNVPVETRYRENEGNPPIPSFDRCPSTQTPSPDQDCGWAPLYVGICRAGQTVILSAPKGVFLRACKGLYGCEHKACTDPNRCGPNGYAGLLASGVNQATFTCPTKNGPSSALTGKKYGYGYFSVLLAPSHRGTAFSAAAFPITGHNLDSYPASEADVFTYREGAFYGDLWSVKDQAAVQPLIACYADKVMDGFLAFKAGRVCAVSSGQCFDDTPEPCIPTSSCSLSTVTKVFQGCAGAGSSWKHAVTTYLNGPCDLARPADRESCILKTAQGFFSVSR